MVVHGALVRGYFIGELDIPELMPCLLDANANHARAG